MPHRNNLLKRIVGTSDVKSRSSDISIIPGGSMQTFRIAAAALVFGLASCAGTGPRIPEDQAVQFQQPGPPFPYNSFICP